MSPATAPVLISCGEPAGIGPEIAVAAWDALQGTIPLAWVGDPRHLPASTTFTAITHPRAVADVPTGSLPVLVHDFAAPSTPGHPDPANAQGVIDVIAACVAWVQEGAAAALCTAPIHKKALIDGADFKHPGHTEYLQALAGGRSRAVMMLASDALRVVPTTIHIALEDVPRVLTPALLRETITITHAALQRQFGIQAPRIVVAGLNPHAGEGGAMGLEEQDWIADVISALAASGMNLRGPLPADTMFHARAREGYDAAIAMYHDQALIPIKTLDFDRGVNVTLGLPFIRTSPDHGTAFDIAGKGIANPTSMIEAIKLAAHMAARHV
ncbi:4-hydroxythreonine-4-phosphate dehydrogenase [Roseobacter denitrificans]|uniref:4-hydroxythreonine-4-phosphate dehydrogenase n=1 Tax=Roseobacter denitrificans (strain ATCC 33942 / OCh 114) TaxID=375451 RepID=PDXA_ROSDO|nr:4-hydroxythreonine-4-phosphate dehydrogenase PdxA [Roseobacter denitrificans]Q164G2.1 RecName: Full=4-hydroxythreonine-4-phosphate dehydrogenase; AltName: Full=4-(phosphohydroxy)-L-threonine dehydrogenase [Roseobacter denitrificans OCh 114]ABG32631.1 4-hydroxythreonine-4-phosphate dehydrogenase [Roseobacter denitrificans OCh 114]AVL52068.1 4-hydroxythreonine-4-phosphate dehydrogenase [Roseobacter denitrificans]SFF93005.1 4-hydroxythreonine-4-phosphate dehydrogenase [Roseobacter denitrificans